MKLYQTSQIDPGKLSRLIEIGRRLNSATSLDELLKLIITEAAQLLESEAASILLLDPHTQELHFKAMSNSEVPAHLKNMPISLDSSIAGRIIRLNQPVIVDNVQNNPSWNSGVDSAINFHTSNLLGVPMHDALQHPIGVLEALNKSDGSRYSDRDIAVLSTLADIAGAAIAKAQLFEELEKAYQKLNDLDRLKSDFIALASHELRTPLSVILGYVSFLREEADDSTAEQLDNVLRAAVRLRSLIQDMLNLRYVDAGQAALGLKQIDLVKLLQYVVHDRDQTADAKQQQIFLHLPKTSLNIYGDPDMMEVILSNLINNAIKFTPEHGRIDIGAAQRGKEVWLYVRDTGIGIPEDQLERVFDRFYQVEPHLSRRYEGMGIGLAIVKELITLHKGRIWAKSTLGRGSEFFIALPAAL